MVDFWWARPDLRYVGGRLHLAGTDLAQAAAAAGGPAFFYSGARVLDNLRRLRAALDSTGLDGAIRYAMKANRFAPLLTWMKLSGLCGIDACSPAEVRHAVQSGFRTGDISYTATSVSDADLAVLARQPDIWINADSLSMIRRLGRLMPGRAIGIRVNPALGVGYGENQLLRYSGDRTSKFGIYREQFPEALALAREVGLSVEGIHFHVGCGYLNGQLEAWGQVLRECRWFLEQVDRPRLVNLGGGLGVPHVATDQPLDLDRWAGLIRNAFAGLGVAVWVEPGDYIVKDAGLLMLQVTLAERKRNTLFYGVDGGFNLAIEPAFYSLPCEPVPAVLGAEPAIAWAPDALTPATIAGNINEALDLFAQDVPLPAMREGDYLALLNAGGYAAAMGSNHCMRGTATEHLLV
ncbi:diaminopimelate decarboxylase [Niveispirillum irakense]|uniref:diaminopimelate decarboxylase n=1 Tax=Niveispirillum irakense TaxID=34011 RepID=UPI0003F587C9|nr:diaminopimelate decarboxylase [Niveispirillum irakense]